MGRPNCNTERHLCTGDVSLLTLLEKDACSAILHDTLLHGETLLVVASSNFENVALVVFAHILSINLLSHSLLIEGTTAQEDKSTHEVSKRDNLS